MNIGQLLKKWFRRNNHPIDRPYIPTPPQGQVPINDFLEQTGDYSETEITAQKLRGFSTTFGEQRTVKIVNDQAAEISQSQNYIVGTGKRVSCLQDIGGICPLCHMEALEFFKAGAISQQDMELQSMYDVSSSANCDSCGMSGCNRHIRPVQLPDGRTLNLCANCQEQLDRQIKKERWIQLIKNVFGFFLSPFIEKD